MNREDSVAVAGDGGGAAGDSADAEHGLGCVDKRENIFRGFMAGFEDGGPDVVGNVDYGGRGVVGVRQERKSVGNSVIFL